MTLRIKIGINGGLDKRLSRFENKKEEKGLFMSKK
jgi:hypothetical protein